MLMLPNETVELVGPFEVYEVVESGRKVPYLTATPLNGGKLLLSLDHRHCIEIAVADMQWLVPFISFAIAVASGYTCHPTAEDEPLPSNPFTRMSPLGVMPEDPHNHSEEP